MISFFFKVCFIFFYFLNFYWSIIDLQSCVSFGHTAKWISYIYIHFFSFWIFNLFLMDKTVMIQDFPGGPVVKTLPSNAGGAGSIPGWGAKIPHASWPKNQNRKQKRYCNKFNKDFKNGPHQKRTFKNKRKILKVMIQNFKSTKQYVVKSPPPQHPSQLLSSPSQNQWSIPSIFFHTYFYATTNKCFTFFFF